MNLKRTFRAASVRSRGCWRTWARPGKTVLARISSPPKLGEQRWASGFYLDVPEEWDDPYRFFRW